jgi:transcriptional regulator with XRE-family HTH domain
VDDINPRYLELSIIRAWLKGGTRDEIAIEFGKSRGTVSNIISKMRNELGNYDAESMRLLAKELREQGITAANCACGSRIFNILEKLKIPEAERERFLETMYGFSQKMDVKADILKDALLQFVKLSDESPFSDISKYLHEKNEEIKQLENKKQKLKEEIQTIVKEKIAYEEKVRSSLKNARTTLVNIDIFVNTRDELESYGIHVEDTDKFARCLQGIRNYSNYAPFKVIEKFSDLKILENEIESKQKIKNDLEIDIKKLQETKFDYDNRLNLKYIKLKNL